MTENITGEDLDRLERYLRDARRKARMGEAIARDDFVDWIRQFAAYLLDKLEDAWRWVRKALGIT